jgi:hypothetical protein
MSRQVFGADRGKCVAGRALVGIVRLARHRRQRYRAIHDVPLLAVNDDVMSRNGERSPSASSGIASSTPMPTESFDSSSGEMPER